MTDAATITFTPINDGAYYTIAQLNELFRLAAQVINSKLDTAVGQERQNIVVGTQRVVRTADPVLLQDEYVGRLYGNTSFNYRRIRNLKPGTAAKDAITVKQAKTLLGQS